MLQRATATAVAKPADEGQHRRCIYSGTTRPKRALVRFVIAPDSRVVPDVEGRLPGRGLWLQSRRDIVAAACTKNLFSRAARRRVEPVESLVDLVEQQLVRRTLERLGLARRAGETVSGFTEVRDRLRRLAPGEFFGVLITATDAAADSRDKLWGLARATAPGMTRVSVLTADELGQALGRQRAVHALIAPGKLAERFVEEAARLAGFRPDLADGTGEESDNVDG